MFLLPPIINSEVQLGGEGRCNRCVVDDISTEHSLNRTWPGKSSVLYSQSLEVNEIFINKSKFA